MSEAFSAETQTLFRWAKRAAIAGGRDTLAPVDVLCGLRALEDEGKLTADFMKAFGWTTPRLVWPTEVLTLYEGARAVPEANAAARRLPFDAALRDVVHRAHSRDASLPAQALVDSLLQVSDPLVVQWVRDNGAGQPAGLLAPLHAALDEAGRLGHRLRAAVLGQDHAIRMLCDAYFSARAGLRPAGPRGLFTFLGPSGTGKTMLARAFATELASDSGGGHAFRQFDMQAMAGPQNFEQLFGAERFYAGSRPGTLTAFVKEHPRSVIVFDEIEKAHPNTIQALLGVLDLGEAVDKALDAPVSFRDTWVIFTTNLGVEFFDPDEGGIVAARELSPQVVFDLLAAARPRGVAATGEPGPAVLSPEFVSRLAKGGAVVLARLESRHLLELVDRHLTLPHGDGGLGLPDLRSSPEARLAFLLSLLPELDARRVAAGAECWASQILRTSLEECGHAIRTSATEACTLSIRCSDQARERLERELADGQEAQVVVIDDDDFVPPVVTQAGRGRPRVVRLAPDDDIIGRLGRVRADLILLDLSIGETARSPRVERGLDILRVLRSRVPGVPVYLYSENPQDRADFDRLVERVLQAGGASGFLPCRRDPHSPVVMEDFGARLEHVLLEVQQARLIRRLQRGRKRLSFVTRYRWEAAERVVVAEVDGLVDELVVGAVDRAAPIRFAGVPTERFADVAGLDRAKRRLQQVRDWLANPGTLGALGVVPPRGYLLAGPPGTGKTLLARAFAGEAGLPFLALAAGELQSKWVGESEARIREVFARARRYAPAIIFIDEIDAIAGSRGETAQEWRRVVVDQLLASMDGFQTSDRPVFVLAATNHPASLDPAVLRPGRFDEVIPIDLPNARARRAFFDRRLAAAPGLSADDVQRLVRRTASLSPAELDRIVREAAYMAAAAGRSALTGSDLDQASRLVRFGAVDVDRAPNEAERRLTAYHEAGHALVHLRLLPDRRLDYLTIIPTEGGALGFLAPEHDESRHDVRLEDVRRQLAVCMAGREAQRYAGPAGAELSAGASQDLRQATTLAWRAISEWGFDTELGPVVLGAVPASRAMSDLAHVRLKAWLEEASALARDVIRQDETALTDLADALLREDALDGDEIREAAAGRLQSPATGAAGGGE